MVGSAVPLLLFAFSAQLLGQSGAPADAPNWLLMDELSINSPLPAGKRFLGWYVDGAWVVEDHHLSLLNFENKSVLMTNNLVVKGSQLHFAINFRAELDPKRKSAKSSEVESAEVIAFDFSNRLYDIRTFDEQGTVADLGGYSLFFMRRGEKQIVLLKAMIDQGLYNLQMAFDESVSKDSPFVCAYDYINSDTQLDVFFNFPGNLFRVLINGKACITYSIEEQLFPEPKATLNLLAYGSAIAPLNIKIKSIEISKVPLMDPNAKSFHSDAESLLHHINEHDPLYAQSASLTNIMLLQGKTRAEIKKMAQLVELLAQRSLRLDRTLTDAQEAKNPVFYDDPQYRSRLDSIVQKIETMLFQNDKMKERFSILEDKFVEFRPVENLQLKLEELDSQISSISSLLTVHRHSKLLEEIEKFSRFLDEHHISRLLPEQLQSLAPSPLETIVKVVAGFIFFMIVVLVALIIRTINYGVKNHIF